MSSLSSKTTNVSAGSPLHASRHPLLCAMFPALLLLPETITSWVTDDLTVNSTDNKLAAYKQRIHNIPTAPTPVRWLLGLASSWTLMLLLGW